MNGFKQSTLLLLTLCWVTAPMADQTPQITINYTREGDSLGIQPVVTNGGNSTIRYDMDISVSHGSNRSNTHQSGYATIVNNEPTILTNARTSYSRDGTYTTRLRVMREEEILATIEEDYQEKD